VRRVLAAGLVLASCSLGPASPTPKPHSEVMVVRTADGGHAIVRTGDGSSLGRLPAGILTVLLSGGDDIAEAYLVAPAGAGTSVGMVDSGHAYSVSESAAEPAPPVAAVLVPGPGLTSFVGRQTVLAVLTADGALTGYQHGSKIWSTALGSPGQGLVQAGPRVLIGAAGDWRLLAPESGILGPPLETGCDPGPIADFGGAPVFDCGGRLSLDGSEVPAQVPAVFPAGGTLVLAFPHGEVWRLHGSSATLLGRGPTWTSAPAASADGSVLFVPTRTGIERVLAANGSHAPLTTAAGANPSVALSRDGNFLYALAGGTLRTFSVADGARVASIPLTGAEIERVVGG
jgi:hypothetical protein